MEEADLCIRFHRLGRTRLVNHVVITSDRRVARARLHCAAGYRAPLLNSAGRATTGKEPPQRTGVARARQ